MKNIILEHIKKYPLMEIRDVAKLIYQSEFGGGHMIPNPQMSLNRIQEEYKSLKPEALNVSSVVENIGNGLSRIYLSCLNHGISANVLNEMFVHSANNKKGSIAGLEDKIELVISMCQEALLEFDIDTVIEFFEAWAQDGYPAMSHSETYRQNYFPAYRVVEENFVKLYEVVQRVHESLESVANCDNTSHGTEHFYKPYVIAIDGMSGSGKSTFAALLQEIFPESNLFHMDDYFLRPEQRTEARLNEVGGNVDYERFYDEIIYHLNNPDGLSYRKYDCCSQKLQEDSFIAWKPLIIIEGSYSHHPYFKEAYDLRVFLDIPAEEQKRRILLRNGEFMLERFISEWIPKENAYFEKFDIKNAATIK